MALEESALSQVRSAIEVGRGGDLIRHVAEWAMQEIERAGRQREHDRFAVVPDRPVPDGGERD
jgi:hypothetical protein